MKRVSKPLRDAGIGLLLIATPAAFAGPVPGGETTAATPPVEHAAFHHLIFANDDVAILNNRYPPGGDSGFHAHYRDLFYVVIQPAPSMGQRMGQPLTAAPMVSAGTAGYSPVGAGPRVHRVVNGEQGALQIIVIELRRAHSSGESVSPRESAPQYVQIAENPRMRAWRLILEAGQSAPAILQKGNGVRIVVRGGLLTTTSSGYPDQTLKLEAGDFAIQNGGATRALRNSGKEIIELVELELK